MKNLISLILLLVAFNSTAQTQEENKAKQVVIDFFEAFHRQDSTALKNLAHPAVIMHSIGSNREGVVQVSTNQYGEFINRITGIPSTTKFEEVIHSYDVKINGPLATVLTPYSFMVDGNLSHCGVNSFTMAKESETWLIVHIIDTRGNENCDNLREDKN